MKKIRAAIVGYGNIGKYVLEALEAAPDFEVAGVVRRNPNDIPDELKGYTVTDTITKLDKVDVAVLATPRLHGQLRHRLAQPWAVWISKRESWLLS